MAAATLAQLRTRVLRKADMEHSSFIGGQSDGGEELLGYINDAYLEIYDLLVSKNQEHFIVEPPYEFSVASGASSADLPEDFYKLVGLDRLVSGDDWFEVRPFNFNERNETRRTIGGSARGGLGQLRRRLIGRKVYFTPPSSAPGSYRSWYVPLMTKLEAETDTVDAQLEPWEDFIVVSAAIVCLLKEESDVTALTMRKAELVSRIEAMAAQRDVGSTDRVVDVQGHYYDPYGDT